MLKGKILSIKWQGQWHVIIDGMRNVFDNWCEVESYIRRVLDKGQDPKKKALLANDVKGFLK